MEGVKVAKRNPKYDLAAEDYRRGMTLRGLAAKYGVAFQVIHGALKARGVELRPNGTRARGAR